MAIPLISLPQNRLSSTHENIQLFGRDDEAYINSGFFGTIRLWDAESNQSCFKANFVFLVKKIFDFLEWIRIGSVFNYRLRLYEQIEISLEHNRLSRERIVAALGGESVCRNIPVVTIRERDVKKFLILGDEYFSRGQTLLQGEDPGGRKFAMIRLLDHTGRLCIFTLHQFNRETSGSSTIPLKDDAWVASSNEGEAIFDTDRAIEFINIVNRRCPSSPNHRRWGQFTIAPKP